MLKYSLILMGLFCGLVANADDTIFQVRNLDPMALLNWKVGDSADYSISAVFGNLGTMHKEVTKEEGNGYWVTQQATLMGQNDKTEMLIDRDTGKVLQVI